MKDLLYSFTLLALLCGTYGQVNAPPSTTVAQGDDVLLVCTTTAQSNPTFNWNDVTSGQTIYSGQNKITDIPKYANIVLQEGTDPQTSILNISAIELEDNGDYRCALSTQTSPSDVTVVTVEVGSSSQPIVLTCNDTHYQATYDTIESKPAETITWILNGVEQTEGIEVEDLGTTLPLYSMRSTITFPATLENYNVSLVCNIGGHQVPTLNRQESKLVDCHSRPQSKSIQIKTGVQGSTLDVLCERSDTVDQPTPAITNFYVYSSDALIEFSTSVTSLTVNVPKPENATNFRCEAGNYLGNATIETTYDPAGTTTPPPTTAPAETTSPETKDAGKSTGSPPTNVGAIVGGVVGGIVLIIIIVLVIKFLVKPECMGGSGSNSGGSRKKPASSAVGSSNGSEKDKIKPSAAPRTQSSIQHTTDNPEQAEYAMVDRKPGGGGKGGGDMPDKGYGAGQNEPAGMVYADLDLSAKAGHTEKQIPQNKDDVVVYSSILV